MPRPGPPRPTVTLRFDADTLAYLDAWAASVNGTRSDLIREAVRDLICDEQQRVKGAGHL